MMLALPSMTQRMRQYERHRKALEAAGEGDEEMDEFIDGEEGGIEWNGDGDITPPPPDAAPTPARLRRFLAATRGAAGRWSLAPSSRCYPLLLSVCSFFAFACCVRMFLPIWKARLRPAHSSHRRPHNRRKVAW